MLFFYLLCIRYGYQAKGYLTQWLFEYYSNFDHFDSQSEATGIGGLFIHATDVYADRRQYSQYSSPTLLKLYQSVKVLF